MMECRVWFVVLALSLSLCFVVSRGQSENVNLNNIDVDEPIVRRSPASDRDLFGYAVVLHQLQPPQAGDDVNTALGNTL